MVRRLSLIIITALLVFCFAGRPVPATPSWVVERGSKLSIEGSSNVNQFTCQVKQYLLADTLRWVRDDRAKRLIFRNSAVRIDVQQFDCHHKFITSDLRKTLKSSQYPFLRIHFLSIEDLTWVQEGATVRGQLVIEIAGVRNPMDMEYKVLREHGDRLRLCGSRALRFTDFQLEPPSKLAGLIRINENIRVNFELLFRPLES